jgi:uncharacterized damage-inducible protein DinB
METEQLLREYMAGPERLRVAVGSLNQTQAKERPIAGKWSTLEVVCHLADFEPIYADRLKRVLAMDEPKLLSADENRFAQRLAYHDRDLIEELHLIEVTRRQMARILQSLAPADWQRVGHHDERGPLTAARLVQYAVNHINHHAPFIEAKRAALGL